MKRPSWLRSPLVSREWADTLQARIERREQERDAALTQVAELKQRVLDTEARHDEAEGKRRQLARWLADEKTSNRRLAEELAAVSIVNTRLTEDLTEVRAQLTDGAAAHWSAQARREKKRADRLQKELDDATFLPAGRIEDSRRWQPGYKEDAS